MDKKEKELEHLRYLYQEHIHRRTTQHTIVTWAILFYTGVLVLSSRPDLVARILRLLCIFVIGVATVTCYLILLNHWYEVVLRRDICNVHDDNETITSLLRKQFGGSGDPIAWNRKDFRYVFRTGCRGWLGIIALVIGGAAISVLALVTSK